jgi:hypothetical protein
VLYLSGVVRSEIMANEYPFLGMMLTPFITNILDLSAVRWGADTGCYAQGERFELGKYYRWLSDRDYAKHMCLFATAPDVVGDADETWEQSKDVLPVLREMGYKAALVAQDGIERMSIEWDAFDVLFLGGTTGWKLSHYAWDLTATAKERGKWVHMGRVNSERRIRTAMSMGCDSVDGTFLAVAPDINFERMLRWFRSLQTFTAPEERQGVLDLGYE